MIKRYPVENKWSQLNVNDILGSLVMSKNVDLDDFRNIKLSKKVSRLVSQASGNFIQIRAIEFFNGKYYLASYCLWETPLTFIFGSLSISEVTVSPGPGANPLDLCVWNDQLFASRADQIARMSNANYWTTSWMTSSFSNSAVNHPLKVNTTKQNLLAGDGNKLVAINSDGVKTDAITFPKEMIVRWIVPGMGVNFIGLENVTYNSYGKGGAVAVWDGLATTLGWNQLIRTESCPMAGVIDDSGVLVTLFADGRLMRFNGSGFSRISELPNFRDEELSGINWGGSNTIAHKIHPNGMKNINGKIYMMLDTSAMSINKTWNNFFQGGCWVYDPNVDSLYLKYSPTDNAYDYGQGTSTTSAISPIILDGNISTSTFDKKLLSEVIFGSVPILNRLFHSPITDGFNVGQFALTKTISNAIVNKNVKIACRFSGVEGDDDEIIFKYRTKNRKLSNNMSITWVNKKTFTTTNADIANFEVGDEVSFLIGRGIAGVTSHITNIEKDGGTYTVTIDEEWDNYGENSWVQIENYKKLHTKITKNDTLGYKEIPIIPTNTSSWVQVKVEMRGTGGKMAISDIYILTTEDKML